MAKNKDPAVLFYPEAYLVGTRFMTFDQKGKYMDLLCFQHQQGHLSEEDMIAICGERDKRIFDKFAVDENGLYYNERMDEEIIRRAKYTDSRHQNGSKGGRPSKPKENLMVNQPDNLHETICLSDENHMDNHMGNHMRNRNINTNIVKDIIEYLNTKLGTKYKSNAECINKHINARLNEGFTLEDFKTVIDKKYDEWAGTEMDKFLRPETLFGTKFQQYLNQRVVPKTEKPAEKPKQPPIERYGNFDPVKAFELACARNFFDED
jgi:uncharacterized phage protein (TIGR02220 family)